MTPYDLKIEIWKVLKVNIFAILNFEIYVIIIGTLNPTTMLNLKVTRHQK